MTSSCRRKDVVGGEKKKSGVRSQEPEERGVRTTDDGPLRKRTDDS